MAGSAILQFSATGEKVPLPRSGQPFLVGRGEHADYVVPLPACSREQFRIEFSGGTRTIRALSIKVPTTVNGVTVEDPIALRDGDRIDFAGLTAVFREAGFADHPGSAERSDTPPGPCEPWKEPDRPFLVDRNVIVGRAPGRSGVTLGHPRVAQAHAEFRPGPDGPQVRDLGSAAGTYLDGVPLSGWTTVPPTGRVGVGPWVLTPSAEGMLPLPLLGRSGIVARSITLPGLDRVSLTVRPCEIAGILGPPGSGRHALLYALAGRSRPVQGEVLVAGLALSGHILDNLSVVPDGVPLAAELTVRKGLTAAARLRLPDDLTPAEIRSEVDWLLGVANLEQDASSRVGGLDPLGVSRTAIAFALCGRPSVLFVPESGFGPTKIVARDVLRTLRGLAERGVTVVGVLPPISGLNQAVDRLLVVAGSGSLAFAGTALQAVRHFEVLRPEDIPGRIPTRSAEEWRRKFEASAEGEELHAVVEASREEDPGAVDRASCRRAKFAVRLGRSLACVRALPGSAVLIALGLATGLGLGVGYGPLEAGDPREVQLLFLLGLSVFALGLFATALRVDRDVVGAEGSTGAASWPGVLSKTLAGTIFAVLLAVPICLLVSRFAVVPGSALLLGTHLVLCAPVGATLGAAVSARAPGRGRALFVALAILLLQGLLSGVPLDLAPAVARLGSVLAGGYWIHRGVLGALVGEASVALRAWEVLLLHCGVAFVAAVVLSGTRPRQA